MADSGARKRSLIVLILAVLAIIAFFAVLFVVSRSDPAADLSARVSALLPAGVEAQITGSDVFLSGVFEGDLDGLVATIAMVDGVGRVFTNDVLTAQPEPPATVPELPPPTTQPPLDLALDSPTFTLLVDRDSVEVSGLLPDQEIIDEIEQAARRLYGRAALVSDLRVGIVDYAPWVSGLPSAVSAAVNVEGFVLEVDGSGATVSGLARDQAAAESLMAELTLSLGFQPSGFIDTRDIAGQLTALLRGVATFETGSAILSEDGMAVLDEAAELLLLSSDVLIRVEGHTDNVGGRQFNQILSEERAQAVVDYLVAQGVDASQLISLGHGETQPIADNDTEEGRAQNRRIEFVVGG